MEATAREDDGNDARAPLLAGRRRNSVGSMRGEFVSRLPKKVLDAVDPERPSHVDFSRSKGLLEGEKEYYEKQFATLRSFEEVDSREESNVMNEEDDHEEERQSEFAMKISNYANMILLALKIYATIKSGSIAIAASTLDSLLDLMAGGILWFTHLSMKSINVYKYPIGKLRVQPVGIIIFAAVMATLGMLATLQNKYGRSSHVLNRLLLHMQQYYCLKDCTQLCLSLCKNYALTQLCNFFKIYFQDSKYLFKLLKS
ncbi:hypothetical protein GUJ93_ZPchr0013g35024 [Zizania palustris]|uniref:Cation efflux protein transmembrane domain-containing protein n=1 Tax=Zizania palustris TaxID=103762 RepID=A0A8J6C1G8_ZIZPA|nr:hypothetical protein GUJ93_ZPchr0013g35024 [Zizania palustris]